MPIAPRLPRRPTDGQQVMDQAGNVYEYDAASKSWVNLGTTRTPQSVTESRDGLVTPTVFSRLEFLKESTDDAHSLPPELKIRPNVEALWYLFTSSDKSIRFFPEGPSRLRMEIDRARLYAAAVARACRGPKGPKGEKGEKGDPAGGLTDEQCFSGTVSADGRTMSFDIVVPVPLVGPVISLRLASSANVTPQVVILVNPENGEAKFESQPVGIFLDQTRTLASIAYDVPTQRLTGSFILASSGFTAFCVLARQKGPVGDQGDPGRCTLGTQECSIDYTGVKFTAPVVGIRKSCDANQLFTVSANLFQTVCVNRLTPDLGALGVDFIAPGPVTSGRAQMLAVKKTLEPCKDLARFHVDPSNGTVTGNLLDDFSQPPLNMPDWNPQGNCTKPGQDQLSDLNWVPTTGGGLWPSPDGSRSSSYPWDVQVPSSGSSGECDPCDKTPGANQIPCPTPPTGGGGGGGGGGGTGSDCYAVNSVELVRSSSTSWVNSQGNLSLSVTGTDWVLIDSLGSGRTWSAGDWDGSGCQQFTSTDPANAALQVCATTCSSPPPPPPPPPGTVVCYQEQEGALMENAGTNFWSGGGFQLLKNDLAWTMTGPNGEVWAVSNWTGAGCRTFLSQSGGSGAPNFVCEATCPNSPPPPPPPGGYSDCFLMDETVIFTRVGSSNQWSGTSAVGNQMILQANTPVAGGWTIFDNETSDLWTVDSWDGTNCKQFTSQASPPVTMCAASCPSACYTVEGTLLNDAGEENGLRVWSSTNGLFRLTRDNLSWTFSNTSDGRTWLVSGWDGLGCRDFVSEDPEQPVVAVCASDCTVPPPPPPPPPPSEPAFYLQGSTGLYDDGPDRWRVNFSGGISYVLNKYGANGPWRVAALNNEVGVCEWWAERWDGTCCAVFRPVSTVNSCRNFFHVCEKAWHGAGDPSFSTCYVAGGRLLVGSGIDDTDFWYAGAGSTLTRCAGVWLYSENGDDLSPYRNFGWNGTGVAEFVSTIDSTSIKTISRGECD